MNIPKDIRSSKSKWFLSIRTTPILCRIRATTLQHDCSPNMITHLPLLFQPIYFILIIYNIIFAIYYLLFSIPLAKSLFLCYPISTKFFPILLFSTALWRNFAVKRLQGAHANLEYFFRNAYNIFQIGIFHSKLL